MDHLENSKSEDDAASAVQDSESSQTEMIPESGAKKEGMIQGASNSTLPIVGLGGSAGSLKPMQTFFR
ncbi:hypothetical protein WJU23_01645 [Prosthecobacter sp. SYSU 5D2]|uniref:hypothetical protein n=1 Tax=Prosthecobacter sp. SYSU 5D2 TaxID=3134134 RepID=UPI0031FF22B5